ncbi:hypothetical protein HanRHA438_Chr10g0452611 [Helianthus annuus]|uniref:Uncharacterized protein n=1 Tax=Helianthus annuus TaxID=4232 RepID=A0A251TNA7_HELAN|nr:hypothetical protein HanXRQr2_Chr10g0440581 [Helianthus annuus]KAJ0513823.1 hypothetical protein HanHA300_Chr10g0362321 [Helianthus annuus]KAJ0521762.1 hypothetical protein HanIR_Chr10g0474801 [Helianthus annuus]KAJ0529928.1 hypothetical protein HanHA89_Chr10g0383791 [Helianthus annuus]KAJ0696799.1 hypothetical protein HanLR1_Chr10g0361491 [Helianthus annuus]
MPSFKPLQRGESKGTPASLHLPLTSPIPYTLHSLSALLPVRTNEPSPPASASIVGAPIADCVDTFRRQTLDKQ